MRKLFLIGIIIMVFLLSCKKDDFPTASGTIKINNHGDYNKEIQTYFVYGFLFIKSRAIMKTSLECLVVELVLKSWVLLNFVFT